MNVIVENFTRAGQPMKIACGYCAVSTAKGSGLSRKLECPKIKTSCCAAVMVGRLSEKPWAVV